MKNASFGQNRIGICRDGSQCQIQTSAVLKKEQLGLVCVMAETKVWIRKQRFRFLHSLCVLLFFFSSFTTIRADSPSSFCITEQDYLTDDEYIDDNAGDDGGVDDDDLTAHNKSVYTPLSLSAPLSFMPLVKVMNRFLWEQKMSPPSSWSSLLSKPQGLRDEGTWNS